MKEHQDFPAKLPDSLRGFDHHVARVSWTAWANLAGLGLVIGVVILWSVFGDIPTRVAGSCIIMHPQGVSDVTADMAGQITELLVQPGAMVEAGQEVAVVATPELSEKIANARVKLADLEAVAKVAHTEAQRSQRLNGDSMAEQRGALALRLESDRKRIRILEQQMELDQRLRADGLITARAAAQTPLDLADARAGLEDTQRKLAELDKRTTDYERVAGGSRSKLDLQLNEARRELAGLEAQSQSVTRLRSQVAGRVVEIKASVNSAVRRDTPVVSIERVDGGGNGGGLEAVMYVSASDGKKIAANDQVELVPGHARKEEHGVLRASVKSTSAYPATPQGLMNTITNPELMRELAHGTATYAVRIALAQNPAPGVEARNPYLWSAAAGSSLPVSSGSLCQGEILVHHERPISLVLPIFRSTVSGHGG
ncbi:NHLP bacteriocin system secretion protein [Duganella sp. Dugasp56]|uniref:NHLP bacteriocin system secretion protein n=1 Tax=Duganella sp. Dugasp56 TaxID=3243046 RepID=UPI0039AF426D